MEAFSEIIWPWLFSVTLATATFIWMTSASADCISAPALLLTVRPVTPVLSRTTRPVPVVLIVPLLVSVAPLPLMVTATIALMLLSALVVSATVSVLPALTVPVSLALSVCAVVLAPLTVKLAAAAWPATKAADSAAARGRRRKQDGDEVIWVSNVCCGVRRVATTLAATQPGSVVTRCDETVTPPTRFPG